MINFVVKADGTKQEFNPEKLNRWAEFASEFDISWSELALKAYRKCYDGCSTSELQNAMISACVDSETERHFQMAGRLLGAEIYKEAFGGFKHIPTLSELYGILSQSGHWAKMDYTEEELDILNEYLDHEKDLHYNYTSMRQIKDKYLVQDRVAGNRVMESPQFMFMGMAMQNMERMPKERRLKDIKKLYTYLAEMKINLPTPMLVNMRTRLKAYASCCVSIAGDTIDSLAANDHIAYRMTAASAGIGSYIQSRSKGDGVRSNAIVHQGKLPYYKLTESLVHANLQSSRGGACTMYYTILDPEVEELLVLKNPMTVVQKQVRNIDYGVTTNKEFARRVAKNEDWMLISYAVAPDLYEALFSADTEKFKELYEYYSKKDVKKKYVKARELAIKMLTESLETGRIYMFFADEVNTHTPFKDKIYSSNLCAEIALPTKPFTNVTDLYSTTPDGEIGLCSLASIVVGRVTEEEYEDVAYYVALTIDNVIDLMEYPFPGLETTAKYRRSIGVGITNLAYAIAKAGLNYSTLEGRNFIYETAERHSYFLHKASLRLAKERGVCEGMEVSKYKDGWVPLDSYNRNIDSLISVKPKYNWATLKQEIKAEGGIRHSVLEAHMPVESSSQLTNTTNGLYPIRSKKIIKSSGSNKNVLIAPESDTLKYDIAWYLETTDLINLYALVQAHTGQTISADLYVAFGENKTLPSRKLLQDYLYMVKVGMKTRYYINTATNVGKQVEEVEDKGCAGGGCTL